MAFIKSEYKGRGTGKQLLSSAYKGVLGSLLDEDTRVTNHMPNGSTWADLIALAVVQRAVGARNKELVCFTAITELRETTEGKTPEKVAIGGNEELAALARALNAPLEEIPEPTGPEGEE